jgi:hypothetical protein
MSLLRKLDDDLKADGKLINQRVKEMLEKT